MKKYILLTLCSLTLSISLVAQSQLNFDGYQDHVLLNGTDLPPPWTAEVWVRKNQLGAYSHLLTSTDGTSGFRLEQYINNNHIGITKAGIADWTFNTQLSAGEWTHLAFVCNGSDMKLFVNGTQTGGTINGTINMPLGMIGLNTTGAGALNAKIDELRIWNAALPASSISDYMLDSIPTDHPQYSNLVHYYRFDEAVGSLVATDAVGTLDGTVVGATYCPIYNKDIAAVAMISPTAYVGVFSANQIPSFRISNEGSTVIDEDFDISYSLDGGAFVTQSIVASNNPIPPLGTSDVSFPAIDLTGAGGIHSFRIAVDLTGDENAANDTISRVSSLSSVTLGDITGFMEDNGTFIFNSNASAVRVTFQREDIFRITLAIDGNFNNPTTEEIVVIDDNPIANITATDEGDYYQLQSSELTLRAYKNPFTFALYNADNTEVIWEESQPLNFGQQTRQRLSSNATEHFYGCGMQNGYFAHKGKSIKIENIYGNWADGDVPNPAPFYMSTAGYGAFRNTFNRGQYDFTATTTLTHNENHFDCYYFYGPGLKEILEGYTYVTGRPFMMPRWGLEFGDADCYNDTGTTADVISQIAQVYRNNDIPGGWILPNDGYSCGYENLEFVVDELDALGFYTGLWTEDGVGNIAYEVGTAGTRAVKLDVALVGPGYLSAFNSGTDAFNGIENNSDARGYIWTVAGWAGTQRFATLWSGDQSGNWENIRFHIPTVIGSGLSAFNAATGDIDGIFGGSGATYVRDLQWKCFTPAMMTISGWAAAGKQPWARGEPYTSYNRDYLKLKMRLTPYLYTYCREAYETGVPTVRGMVLEFPDDPTTYDATTQYQFMSGEYFLVAPVYENTTTRNDIYLPEDTWIDYWDGTRYEGPMTLDGYSAPLEKLPLLVKAGAIIPMYPEMLHDRELPKNPITYDVYPKGNSSFTLYEDDGHSRAHETGAFAKTQITVTAPESGFSEPIVINVGATNGDYDGKLANRANIVQVHVTAKPAIVKLNNNALTEYPNATDWENAASGWYYDADDKMGMVYVKTTELPVSTAFEIVLLDFVNAVQEAGGNDLVTIYPNPTAGKVLIKVGEGQRLTGIRVLSVSGVALEEYNNDITSDKMELELIKYRGRYVLLELRLESGEVVVRGIKVIGI
jgi:alpha-glucosidase